MQIIYGKSWLIFFMLNISSLKSIVDLLVCLSYLIYPLTKKIVVIYLIGKNISPPPPPPPYSSICPLSLKIALNTPSPKYN